jgi:hypothetical protein
VDRRQLVDEGGQDRGEVRVRVHDRLRVAARIDRAVERGLRRRVRAVGGLENGTVGEPQADAVLGLDGGEVAPPRRNQNLIVAAGAEVARRADDQPAPGHPASAIGESLAGVVHGQPAP